MTCKSDPQRRLEPATPRNGRLVRNPLPVRTPANVFDGWGPRIAL